MEKDEFLFPTKEAFREWLSVNVDRPGAWLVFGKKGGPKTLSAAEALEEALCFGWIDGEMESLGDDRYKKYFSPRRPQSKWSPKNRKLAESLQRDGRMTEHGRKRIEEAKRSGAWETAERFVPTEEQVQALADALRPHETAYANFMNMTPSVRRTYTGFCLDVKSAEAGEKRFSELVERLNLNLGPMESLKKKKEELGL